MGATLVGAEQVDFVACCTLVTTTMTRTTLAEDVSHNASVIWPVGMSEGAMAPFAKNTWFRDAGPRTCLM